MPSKLFECLFAGFIGLGWPALAAASNAVLDRFPVQYAGTTYNGPEYIPHENGTEFVTPPGQDLAGLTVGLDGRITGNITAGSTGKTIRFTVCAAAIGVKDCLDPVRNYDIVLQIGSRARFAGRTPVFEVEAPQYIATDYNGPQYVGGMITGDLKFKRVTATNETAGLSVDDAGQIAGKIAAVEPGLRSFKVCLVSKSDASPDPKCVRELMLVLNVQPRPRIDEALVASAIAPASGPAAPAAIPSARPIEIRDAVSPGQSQIFGNATPTLASSGNETRIIPKVNGVPVSVKDSQGAIKSYVVTDDKGAFTLNLATPLASEDVLTTEEKVIHTADESTVPLPAAVNTTAGRQVVDSLDLGRVRYYFTSGVVLSNSQQFAFQPSSTQAGLFLGLDVDRAWIVAHGKGRGRIGLNTYFDARLTSVATQQESDVSSRTTGSGSTTTTTNGLDAFVKSNKAAALNVGTYIPITTNDWHRGDKWYSFFLAPIAKAGFTTLTDQDVAAATVATITSSGTTSTTAASATQRFFTSYSFGARLGVVRNYRTCNPYCRFDSSSAPDLISFVDITTGKFGNFEAVREFDPASATHSLIRVRPWRYSFEGLLKIPHSVFIVGFNANIGQGARSPDKNDKGILQPFGLVRDDLRFLFGARFDFSRLLRAIPSL